MNSRLSRPPVPYVSRREQEKEAVAPDFVTDVRHRPGRPKKEVFQPHLPVRLPCYDLAPVTGFALDRSSRLQSSGTPGSHGLTGGVYKARERIHRAMADARLLANRVGLQTPIRTGTGFRDPLGVAAWPPSVPAIVTRVSPRT